MIQLTDSYIPTNGMTFVEVKRADSPYLLMFTDQVGQVQDEVNRNKRRYSTKLWDKQLDSKSDLMRRLGEGIILGVLDHPESGSKADTSRSAIKVNEINRSGNNILISGGILKTPMGAIVSTLNKAGVKLGTSTRGNGNATVKDGIEDIDSESYHLKAWDIVLDPGFVSAKLDLGEGARDYVEEYFSTASEADLDAFKEGAESLGAIVLTEALDNYKTEETKRRQTMEKKILELLNSMKESLASLKEASQPAPGSTAPKVVDFTEHQKHVNTLTEAVEKLRTEHSTALDSIADMEDKYLDSEGRDKFDAACRVIEKQDTELTSLKEEITKLKSVAEAALGAVQKQRMIHETVLPKYPHASSIITSLVKCETLVEMETLASQTQTTVDAGLPPAGGDHGNEVPPATPRTEENENSPDSQSYPGGLTPEQAKMFGVTMEDNIITARAKIAGGMIPRASAPKAKVVLS